MFAWSKKNDSKKKPKRRGGSGGPVLNEFGLPVTQSGGGGNDEELEAELRALTGGVISLDDDLELNDEGSDVEAEFMRMFGESKGKKKKSKKSGGKVEREDGPEPDLGFDPIDANEDLDDEDIDVDENDPELLGELMGLTEGDEDEEEEEEGEEDEPEEKEEGKKEVTVASMLKERLNMYKEAEAKAKENKESSRARRFGRGIKTLQQLIKKAEAGQPVLPSEIPPVIATNLKPAPPPSQPPPPPAPVPVEPVQEPETEIPPEESDLPIEEMNNLSIDTRPNEDSTLAEEPFSPPVKEEQPEPRPEPEPELIKTPIPVVENVLLSMLKSRRDEYKASALAAKRNNDLETALKHVKFVKEISGLIEAVERGEEIEETEIPPSLSEPSRQKKIEKMMPLKFEAPEEVEEYEIPRTTLEALNQRLRIYEGFKIECQRKGDQGGIDKNSKIVQIYSEAIKLHKAGKKIPFLKLPTPPGCPPIPIPFEID